MLFSLKLEKGLLDIGAVSYGTIYLMTSKTLQCTSLLSFKHRLKSYLLQTLEQLLSEYIIFHCIRLSVTDQLLAKSNN